MSIGRELGAREVISLFRSVGLMNNDKVLSLNLDIFSQDDHLIFSFLTQSRRIVKVCVFLVFFGLPSVGIRIHRNPGHSGWLTSGNDVSK